MLKIKLKITEFKPPGLVGKVFVFVYGNADTSNTYTIESYNEEEDRFRIFGGGFYNRKTFIEDLKKGSIKITNQCLKLGEKLRV